MGCKIGWNSIERIKQMIYETVRGRSIPIFNKGLDRGSGSGEHGKAVRNDSQGSFDQGRESRSSLQE